MTRFFITLLIGWSAAAAEAHFYYVLPATATDPARVVYADRPEVDASADPGPAEALRLSPGGRLTPGGPGFLAVADAPAGSLAVEASPRVSVTNYAKPTLVRHSARFQPDRATASAACEGLVVTFVSSVGGTVASATLAGKPVAVKLSVWAAGEKRPTALQTGPDGLSPVLTQKGLLSARAILMEARAGELKGEAYQQVCHYATATTVVE